MCMCAFVCEYIFNLEKKVKDESKLFTIVLVL